MVNPLLSAKEGKDIVPNVTGAAASVERKMELYGAGALLGSEKKALAVGSGPVIGGGLKRPFLGKAQLEVG